MKHSHIARSSILVLLLFVFALAKAQLTITPTTTPACHSADGAVTFTVTGASGPFTYYLYQDTASADSGSFGPPTIQTSATFTGLAPGSYFVEVNGYEQNFVIQTVDSVHISATQPVCPATTGSMTAVVTSGGGSYTYAWSNSATTTASQSGLAVGTILTVTVTDVNGCTAAATSTVQSISTVSASISHIGSICARSLIADASGGTSPYQYLWGTGATTDTITGLVAYQSYTVTITDINGCAGSAAVTGYATTIQIDSGYRVSDPACGVGGQIVPNITNGAPPYSFAWSNGAAADSIFDLAAGPYSVTVTDANGCTGSQNYTLVNSNNLQVQVNSSNPTCGNADGNISLSVYGGTNPYSYQWGSGISTTASAGSLAAGEYYFTVNDVGGCVYADSVGLSGKGSFAVTVSTTPTACAGGLATGTATAIVSGVGTPPYTFDWQLYGSSVVPGNGSTISGLGYGTYVSLESVTDANGCYDSVITTTDSGVIIYDPSCYDYITGYAYTDVNGNCIKDAGEPGTAGIYIGASGGASGTYYATTDATGYYYMEVPVGNYVVNAYTSGFGLGYCNTSTCISSYLDSFTTTGQLDTADFGYTYNNSFDLGVHTGYNSSTPGASKEYWIYYYNRGTVPVSNAVITFVHDPNLTLTSTTPAYTSYDAATYTITWAIGTVPVSYWDWTQVVTMEFNVPAMLPLNTLINAYSSIAPITGDCDPTDNTQTLSDVVTGSHDPNEKIVSPAGNITASDTVLNYTLRFQNTGNAPATHVVIVDTLSSSVSPATVEPGASSSPYKFSMTGKGILTFTFDPIYLPDSSHGQDSSTGFVMYSVHVKPGTALGTQIANTGYIYFDINPAVVTNTTISTESLYPSGIRNINAGNMDVTVTPNPVHDRSVVSIVGATGEVAFQLNDITGQRVFEANTSGSSFILDGSSFAAGMYIYSARDANGNIRTGKVTISH